MGRKKNDGRGRLGGRQKGTPNKVTSSVKDWLSELIDNNRNQVEKDLKRIEPKERLQVIERFMQYVVPKQQAVRANVEFENLTNTQLDLIIDEITKEIDDEIKD